MLTIGNVGQNVNSQWRPQFILNRTIVTILLILFANNINCLTSLDKLNSYKLSENLWPIRNVTCLAYNTRYHCVCEDIDNQEFQLPQLFGSVYHLEISRCFSLTIHPKTIWNLHGLRSISIYSIKNLTLLQDALALPLLATYTPLVILFQNVNINLIESHAIAGPIEEISFKKCQIQAIRPFALTVIKDPARSFQLNQVYFEQIDPQAFKKFTVEKLEITQSVFKDVPSKFFYEIEVLQTFLMEQVHFQFVHSRAFVFKSISKLMVVRCSFKEVDAEWLNTEIKDSAIMRDNDFGLTNKIAFKGIRAYRNQNPNEKIELRLNNVTLDMPEEQHNWNLEFNESLVINLKSLYLKKSFTCNQLNYTVDPPQPYSKFLQKWKDTLYFPKASQSNEYIPLSEYIQLNCQLNNNYWLWLIMAIIGILLIITSSIVTLIIYRRKKKRQRLKLDIVKPEPRTYKETQIIYQIENAGLLKTDL